MAIIPCGSTWLAALGVQNQSRVSSNNNSSDSVFVDRISALPDCILGDILSFLPTQQAVATSLLSKRWKSAWVEVHSLAFDFDSSFPPPAAEAMGFIRFVHRVLLLIGAKPLTKFSLELEVPAGIIYSHIICWIDAAIIRKVRKIKLYLAFRDSLPISGFNCDSLQCLKLSNNTLFYDDTTLVCLPRLETLKLDCVIFIFEEAFEKLIHGCPMLHYLDIDDGLEDFMYIIFSPSLRRLDMSIDGGCTLKLNAPSLEYLSLVGRVSDIFVEKSLTSLVEAVLDFELDEHDLPHNLIVEATRVLEHAKFLTTSGRFLRAVDLATKFKRLVKLVVDHCCGLQDLLHYSENLEEVEINQDDDDWWRQSTIEPCDHSRWTAPVVVPRCLSKSLKKVLFDGYKGLEDEHETIRYMLEHGTALEVMEIYYEEKVDGEKLLKEICEFPRKSPACKVSTWPVNREL